MFYKKFLIVVNKMSGVRLMGDDQAGTDLVIIWGHFWSLRLGEAEWWWEHGMRAWTLAPANSLFGSAKQVQASLFFNRGTGNVGPCIVMWRYDSVSILRLQRWWPFQGPCTRDQPHSVSGFTDNDLAKAHALYISLIQSQASQMTFTSGLPRSSKWIYPWWWGAWNLARSSSVKAETEWGWWWGHGPWQGDRLWRPRLSEADGEDMDLGKVIVCEAETQWGWWWGHGPWQGHCLWSWDWVRLMVRAWTLARSLSVKTGWGCWWGHGPW